MKRDMEFVRELLLAIEDGCKDYDNPFEGGGAQ